MPLKFNPAFLTDEESVRDFVVRNHEFETIVDAFVHRPQNDHSPHVLIVGTRGAGKTTLCRRIAAEARLAPTLAPIWLPVFLSEESYSVTTAGEFFLECLFQLRDQAPHAAGLDAAYRQAAAAEDEAALLDRSLGGLRAYAESLDRRLLILVENFHTILNDQMQGPKDAVDGLLRLLDDSLFGVLATTVTSTVEEEGPLGSCRYIRVELKPLTLRECRDLWEALTGGEIDEAKLRPLEILTGGSPRLLHILAEFMRTPSLQDLMANLNYLIDQNTEYFKSQLDALPSLERKVFVTLLDTWDPSTAKQIAESARVSVNTASAMLSRLTDRGAVIKQQGQGRTAIYYAAERLFNIYYLMRRRSHPSNRVRALVNFMMGYYDGSDLVDTTAKLAAEACALPETERRDHHSTFDAVMANSDESVRQEILARTPGDFIRSLCHERRADGLSIAPYLVGREEPTRVSDDHGDHAFVGRAGVWEGSDPGLLADPHDARNRGIHLRREVEADLRANATSAEAHIRMIRIETRDGNYAQALRHIQSVLNVLPGERAALPKFVAGVMEAADAIEMDRLVTVLAEHPNAITVEPLTVAIRMMAGEKPLVAKEIRDVAFDIIVRHVSTSPFLVSAPPPD